jgi:hypothetical protein
MSINSINVSSVITEQMPSAAKIFTMTYSAWDTFEGLFLLFFRYALLLFLYCYALLLLCRYALLLLCRYALLLLCRYALLLLAIRRFQLFPKIAYALREVLFFLFRRLHIIYAHSVYFLVSAQFFLNGKVQKQRSLHPTS